MDRTIHAIRQRAAELDRRLADWELTGKVMREERDELRAFLRTYERFAEDGEVPDEPPEPDLEARRVVAEAAEEPEPEKPTRSATAKPEGVPTVPEMAFEALAAADVAGKPGLMPKDILVYIRQKYWREAPSDSVGPIVWRMWAKDKRLDKIGDLYSLKADPSGQLFQHQDSGDASSTEDAG